MTSRTVSDKYVGVYDVRNRRETIEIQTIEHNNVINNFDYGPSVPFRNDLYVRPRVRMTIIRYNGVGRELGCTRKTSCRRGRMAIVRGVRVFQKQNGLPREIKTDHIARTVRSRKTFVAPEMSKTRALQRVFGLAV